MAKSRPRLPQLLLPPTLPLIALLLLVSPPSLVGALAPLIRSVQAFAGPSAPLRTSLAVHSIDGPDAEVDEDPVLGKRALYERAKTIRATSSNAAVASRLYRNLLSSNPTDVTAATRIAASDLSPSRHDKACNTSYPELISDLRRLLEEVGYNNSNVQRLFGIEGGHPAEHASGPVWAKIVPAGFVGGCPLLPNGSREAAEEDWHGNLGLRCLVTMFLLGFAGMYAVIA